MKLKRTPELLAFFTTHLAESDIDQDSKTAQAYATANSSDRVEKLIAQIQTLLKDPELPIEEFGSEANRWFGEIDEARAWLDGILLALEAQNGSNTSSEAVVKDSNGAVLAEGDSVTVIKDLKVKGGSSDLKRGTLIKKIHLIGDPDNIECRVDGSTLVLKTCFLKKA